MRFDSLYPLVPLGKLVEFINGDRSSNYPKPSDYVDGGIPFISATDIDGGRINLMSAKRISRSAFERLRGGHVRRGDILLCLRGSLGKMGVVQNIDEGAIASSLVILRSHDESILRYVRYVLSGGAGMALLDSLNNGSVQGNISVASLKKMEVPFPPRLEMEAIGSLISMFDMRIDLLLETNASLESISEAFFKSWFIDFDPVRAKAEGREPEGMCADIAALFPSEFVDSESGPIPKGWSVGSLADMVDFQNGYAFKSKDWVDSGYPVVKIGDVKPGVIDFTGCSFVSAETTSGLERFRLNRGDLLVGMTGYVGETGLVPGVDSPVYLNQRVGRFFAKNGGLGNGYVYCAVRDPAFKEYAESQSHGSAQANVSGSSLLAYPCVIPTPDVLSYVDDIIRPVIEAILSNHEMAITLSELRDSLLPRLLSGVSLNWNG